MENQTSKYPHSTKETIHLLGGRLVTLSSLLISVFLDSEFYCSIQRFSRDRDRSIVIGTRVLVNTHLHPRSRKPSSFETRRLYTGCHRSLLSLNRERCSGVSWDRFPGRGIESRILTREKLHLPLANTCSTVVRHPFKRKKETQI